MYTPNREVSIDESLFLWKGRLSFKQFIRIKRARFGIKSFVVTEALSGYVWKLIVYRGKGSEIDVTDFGQGTNVVLSLMKDLLNQGYCVYSDNFYTSPELAMCLNTLKTDLVGTVRSNRKGLPKRLVHGKLKRGDCLSAVERRRRRMIYTRWLDKRDVYMLSTKHKLKYVPVLRKGKTTLVPNIVHDYNKYMGGVDKLDQILSAYPTERKRQKIWYKKQFRHIINIVIFNAHVIHRKLGGQMTSLKFRENLVEQIVLKCSTNNDANRCHGRPSLDDDPLRLTERHFPELIPSGGEAKSRLRKTRRCHVCARYNKRSQTRYMCVDCDIGLCVTPCFRIHHTQRNY